MRSLDHYTLYLWTLLHAVGHHGAFIEASNGLRNTVIKCEKGRFVTITWMWESDWVDVVGILEHDFLWSFSDTE